MQRFLEAIFRITCGLVVVGIIGIVVMGYGFRQKFGPKTSIAQYSEIVEVRKQGSRRYAILPDSVDPKAEKVAFYHIPGFLQGGDRIRLRLKLPDANIKQVLAGLEKSGRLEASNSRGVGSRQCYPEFGIEMVPRDKLPDAVFTLPEGFRIFLFESDLEDIKRHPNHNFLAFTAVSVAKGEVVYFVDSW